MKLLTLFATLAFSTTVALCETATMDSLKGTYVFSEQGGIGTNQVMAGLGTMTLDGKGNIVCNESIEMPGLNANTTCTGTYTINADGSGTISINHILPFDASTSDASNQDSATVVPATITAKYRFFQTSSGKELRAIRTENGIFVIANFTK